jgi:hypothetical protein
MAVDLERRPEPAERRAYWCCEQCRAVVSAVKDGRAIIRRGGEMIDAAPGSRWNCRRCGYWNVFDG